MRLADLLCDGRLLVKVRPLAGKTYILKWDPLTIGVKEAPEGGKVNRALTKFIGKELGCKVELVKGVHLREKVFKIIEE